MTRAVWLVTAAALVVGSLADVAVGADVPGFTAALGFVGCVLLVHVSKLLGKRLLQRPETYWTEPDVTEGLPADG